jgi:uncharacterized protein with HEPN domain
VKQGLTYEKFLNDAKTIDAVIRQIIVIGEVATQIPEEIISQIPETPWRSIRGIRNSVVHEYFGIKGQILWQTIVHNLSLLKSQLKSLRANLLR